MASAAKFKRLIRELEEWATRHPAKARETDLREIESALKSSKKGVRHTPVYVDSLGFLSSCEGQLAILRGDAEGWRSIDRAVSYYALAAAIYCPWPKESSLQISLAFAIGRDSDGRYLGVQAMQHLDGERGKSLEYSPYAPFALRLWHEATGTPQALPPLKSKNPYKKLEDQLLAPNGISPLLEEAAERHVLQASSNDDDADFLLGFELLPVEILWLERFRRERSLPVKALEHPLLNTPLAKPPAFENFPRYDVEEDELFCKVRAAAEKEGLPLPSKQ